MALKKNGSVSTSPWVNIGFAVVFGTITVIAYISHRTSHKLVRSDRLLLATLYLYRGMEDILTDLFDAEGTLKDYETTHDPEVLRKLNGLVTDLDPKIKQLSELSAARVDVLIDGIHELLPLLWTESSLWTERAKTTLPLESPALTSESWWKKHSQTLAAILEKMQTIEQSQAAGLALVSLNAERSARHASWAMFSGSLATMGVLVTSFLTVRRQFGKRDAIEKELSNARDQALESARLKSEFVANMSHEIRTPMNGVIGITSLLLQTPLAPQQKDFAETISRSAEALLSLLNDILDFSKMEAGKLHFEEIEFALHHTVEDVLELMSERAHAKKLELVGYVRSDASIWLRGDPGRLRQILTNLVGNAIKFTENGEVAVQVRKESETITHVTLRFDVTDTGIGIPQEAKKHLFQPFMQVDGSTTRKYGGTGLGLVISKQLVERMEGSIGVESKVSKGSTFWFSVRIQKGATQPPPTEPALDCLAGKHVLIVDDNATNRENLRGQTLAWKFRSSVASSGSEALTLLKEGMDTNDPYSLVLLDMEMPEMDGLTLARAINSDPAYSGTRLVMLTSLEQQLDTIALKSAGIEMCLIKPVKQSRLFDCISSVLSSTQPDPPRALQSSDGNTEGLLRTLTPSNNVKILLAEDNSVNQKVALGQLRKLGFRAQAVANGLEAIEALALIRYDLILMDCQMPEMDGYEAARAIRIRENQQPSHPSKRIYIIAMTANAMAGDREKCLQAGMDDYVSKPVRLSDLKTVLGRWQVRTMQGADLLSESLISASMDPIV